MSIILFFLIKLKKLDIAIFSFIIFSTSCSSGFILKFIFQRPRPISGIANLIGYSFPSGHAILAIALVFITYFASLN